jgi:hypothetical protein
MRDLNRISLALRQIPTVPYREWKDIVILLGLDWGEVAFAAQNSKNSKQANHGDGRT